MKNPAAQELKLTGTPISQGIAIGKSYFFSFSEEKVQELEISAEQVESEVQRYRQALEKTKADIERLLEKVDKDGSTETVDILETHRQIMEDPLLTIEVEEAIRSEHRNADYLFMTLMGQYQERFQMMKDAFFQERAKDLHDIARRVMGHLCTRERASLTEIGSNTIVFSEDLAASDVAEAHTSAVSALVTSTGSTTSHAAIVAKAKGIPFVGNIHFFPIATENEMNVIVDGETGEVIFNPDKETLKHYKKLKKQVESEYKALEKTGSLKPATADGQEVPLLANLEVVDELDRLHKYGGSGVGLFRSEYLFLSRQDFPSEAEQFKIYREVVQKMRGLPIVIRTFDIGGDKLTEEQQEDQRGNPYLGCRAIRFLLKEKKIFKTQLRAILRAGAYGDVRILFPMVTSVTELIEAKQLIQEAQKELKKERKQYMKEVPIGCMIEVPAAAIIADLLAKECDFLSIGTNDLIQYSLAADRSHQEMSVQYSPTHPSVIRLIKMIVKQANDYNIPVTVCGEVAADPKFTALLLGLGVKELSVSLRYLPIIKQVIRNTRISEAKSLVRKVLKLTTSEEIADLLQKEHEKANSEELTTV